MTTNPPLKPKADVPDADDDLDELDDLLDQFQGPPSKSSASTSAPQPRSKSGSEPPPPSAIERPKGGGLPGLEEDADGLAADFAAELAKGMENLMREITPGENGKEGGVAEGGSEEEQARMFKAAWEAMLIEGLGGEGEEIGEVVGSGGVGGASGSGPNAGGEKGGDFASTIRQTMDRRKEGDEALNAKKDNPADPLAALLASLGGGDLSSEDLAALSNLGLDGDVAGGDEPESEEALQGMLEQMMSQLMSRELLHEPLAELVEKYPAYIEKNAATLSAEDKKRYEEQLACAKKIIAVFDDPKYSDSDVEMNAKVVTLMTEMQSHGSPPSEIMGPLPPGMGLGPDGMPQMPEGCTIA